MSSSTYFEYKIISLQAGVEALHTGVEGYHRCSVSTPVCRVFTLG